MPQSLDRVLIHTVFSTKDREPALQNPDFRSQVHSYLGGCAKTLGCMPIQVGGMPDHVHLLTTLGRQTSIAAFVKEVKRVSTAWIRQRGGLFGRFRWQAGYGCFSVSESMLVDVTRYIENQEHHHRIMTFQEELRKLLHRHGLKWDEQYLWD